MQRLIGLKMILSEHSYGASQRHPTTLLTFITSPVCEVS
jgi:hypothetical protein